MKLLILLLPLLILMLTSCSLPQKNIHTDIVIHAHKEAIWQVLADFARYPEWNPYHVKVEGAMQLGAKLYVEIEKPNGESVQIDPHIMQITPYQELTWGGGVAYLFTGKHQFLLEAIKPNQTRLIHKERFDGIFIPFAKLEAIKEGYIQMNQALKKRVESKLNR